MKNKILPVFITFAGCTSKCVYCNQHHITGVSPKDVIKSAKDQIKENMAHDVEWTELAFYGGSFTCLPVEIREQLYGLAKTTGISRLRFSTSPDCINDEIMAESVENGVKVAELGVQSLDDNVLKANRRPYTVNECLSAFAKVKEHIDTCGIQLMTGLYKETFLSFADTVDKAVGMKADYARIYPTVVIKDTELAQLWEDGVYKPLSLADAVARCAYGLIRLSASGCEVIRIGLQDSPSVKNSALAGAYHPAIGEMAKTVAMQTYVNLTGEIVIGQQYLNVAYGYGGYLKNMCKDKVVIKEGIKPDFIEISKVIMEKYGEDNKRKLQKQIADYAEGLVSQTNNG